MEKLTDNQKRTLDGLDEPDLRLFMHKNRCHLKRSDASFKLTFGFLTVENALQRNYCVENDKSLPELVYASVDDLVNDGWVVD